MAEPIKPKSRLDDRSLANSNAIAEARRAKTSERVAMATERSLQRQYRRAVRRGDIDTVSKIGSHMQGLGMSALGGGGIQSAEENNRIASDRAFNRADQLNQAWGRAGSGPSGEETETITMNGQDYQMPKQASGGLVEFGDGKGAADDIEAAAGAPGVTGSRGTNGRTGNGTINPAARKIGTVAARESRLLPENNPAPSSRPKPRFSGVSEMFEPVSDFFAGPLARVSDGEKQGSPGSLAFTPEDETAIAKKESDALYEKAVKSINSIKEAGKLIDEGIASTDRALERKSPLDEVIPEPPVAKAVKRTDVSGAPKAVVVNEEAPAPGWWNDSMTSPEARAADIKSGIKAQSDQYRSWKKEYDQIAGELIEEKVRGIELPDWQKTNVLGRANRAVQEKLIRAGGVGLEMDQRIRGIMAQRSALKKANERSAEIRRKAANLLPETNPLDDAMRPPRFQESYQD